MSNTSQDRERTNSRITYANNAQLFFFKLFRWNLFDADLSGANLSSAKVENSLFGYNKGISDSLRQDLIRRGAIFEDSPGDRSEVLTRV